MGSDFSLQNYFHQVSILRRGHDSLLVVINRNNQRTQNIERHVSSNVNDLRRLVEELVPDMYLSCGSPERHSTKALAHGSDRNLEVIQDHNEFLETPHTNFSVFMPR